MTEEAGGGKGRPLTVAVCCLGVFVAFLDITIVNVAFPDLERDFDSSSLAALSWVVNGYNVVIAAFLVPAGRLADRFGRRRSFIAGMALFTAASAVCSVAGSVEVLVAARLVQAAGAAVLVPTSLALLLPAFPSNQRLTAVSVWGAAGALAAGIGPSLGGLLVDLWSWRAVFLVNIPVGIVTIVAARRVLVEQREERGPMPDLAGAALLALALALVALGIVKANQWGWSSASTISCLAGGAILLPVIALRCMRHPSPIVDPDLVRSRTGAVGNAGTLLFSIGFYAAILNNVLFLTSVWHWSVLEAGLAISPSPLITAAVARPGGRLADRIGARAVIVPGTIVYIAGTMLLVWGSGHDPSFLTHWFPGAALVGVGIGLAFPNLIGSALARVEVARLATGSGVNSAARQLGGVLGIALLISIVSGAGADLLGAHRTGWYMAAGFAFAAGAIALLLPRGAAAAAAVPEATHAGVT